MFRIAYGRLFHEANAYSPIPTTLEDFERMHLLSGPALERATTLRGTELKSFMPHAELTGFRQAMRFAKDVTCIPLESSLAVPGGPLTRECFDLLVARLLDRIEAALPLDGIYLALHGSMQVAGLREAPEAFLLRRVREVAGPRVRIAVSYDLHANLSSGLVDPASVLVAYRTNPHWDLAPTGFRAGRRLLRVLRGEIDPVHAWRKLPMVLGGGTTIDFLAPMRGVFRFMRSLEKDPRVVSASLFTVHPYTDAERIGWAAHVSTNGDPALAEELADRLADRAWAMREIPPPPMRAPEEALDVVAKSFRRKLGPVTLVDVDDVGAPGAPGGNTHIVKALVERGSELRALVPVHDPALIEALANAPIGSSHDLVLRGTPGYDMPAVTLRAARVAAKTEGDFGRMVRLDVGKGPMSIVVTERAPLPIHPSFWKSVGLSARAADLVVQKNFFHYRLFYATTSFEHVPVVSSGATSLTRIRDREYDIPMAPRAKLEDWRPYDAALKTKVEYDAKRDHHDHDGPRQG